MKEIKNFFNFLGWMGLIGCISLMWKPSKSAKRKPGVDRVNRA